MVGCLTGDRVPCPRLGQHDEAIIDTGPDLSTAPSSLLGGPNMSKNNDRRQEFNERVAAQLATRIGCATRWDRRGADRFAFFVDDERFVVAAGEQEATGVDLALAYGLTWGARHRLILILPDGYDFPTLQRTAWLKKDRQPVIYVHDGSSTVERRDVPGREETIERLRKVRRGLTPEEEFRHAATPLYLGKRAPDVAELVEWATKDRRLEPGHRQGERAWSCMGQKVLSIRRGGGIRAGIHTSNGVEAPMFRADRAGGPLTEDVLKWVVEGVEGVSRPDSRDRTIMLAAVGHPPRSDPRWRRTAGTAGSSRVAPSRQAARCQVR
jgi:hypothetical protein